MPRTSARSRPNALAALLAGVALAPAAAHGRGGLRKGPWLMEPRGDSITVMLERATPGPVVVRATPLLPPSDGVACADPATIEARDAASVALHEVRLAGLVPGMRYRYEVAGPGLAPVSGSFSTAPAGDAPFRFVVYGDTRSNDAVHGAMVRAIAREGADFVVHTGDMLADGRDEGLWQRFFEIEHDLLVDTPLVPVIGNHEIVYPRSPGVDAFRRYVHCEPVSPDPEIDYAFGYGSVRIVVANAYSNWGSPAVRAWLDAQLARARAEVPEGFVIVAMHWGLCSSSLHGENVHLRRAGIDELLRAHHVDLLLSGHDHLYERGDDHGLRYVMSGGGGAELYPHVHEKPYTLAYASEHHYVRADVEHGAITFSAVRMDGTVIDRCVLRKSGWDCPRPSPAAPEQPSVTAARVAPAPRLRGTRGSPWARRAGIGAALVVAAAWWASRGRGRQRARTRRKTKKMRTPNR